MPMAGEGSRFKDAGYDIPKPLIKVDGKELYRHSLDSINIQNVNIKYTFIVRKEFITDYNIDKEIKKYYPYANIISVEKTTRGALETLMLAEPYIDDNDYVISMDCDIKFECETYMQNLRTRCLHDSVSHVPMVLSFYSKSPIYSYVHPINSNYGDYLAEKKPISTYALCGCYGLGLGKNLKIAAKEYIKDFEDGKIVTKELYLSLVINYILKLIKANVQIIDMNMHKDHFWSLGTPYDLEHYSYDKNIWDV
jgi:NDP-sugar pyrophosphorylase family protein